LVTPECGILIGRTEAKSEAQKYSDVLKTLLANPQQRKEMGEKGRLRVAGQFPLQKMGERMETLVRQATAFHEVKPRPLPSLELGKHYATLAVEQAFLRSSAKEKAEFLENSLQGKVYHMLQTLLAPLYRFCLDRGWTWPSKVWKRVIKNSLMGRF